MLVTLKVLPQELHHLAGSLQEVDARTALYTRMPVLHQVEGSAQLWISMAKTMMRVRPHVLVAYPSRVPRSLAQLNGYNVIKMFGIVFARSGLVSDEIHV